MFSFAGESERRTLNHTLSIKRDTGEESGLNCKDINRKKIKMLANFKLWYATTTLETTASAKIIVGQQTNKIWL